ncbi:hypothetical protein [Streptomyces sp. NPDC020951]|uniref:hypothetical protein n=1 Tax=Streptomyces sp. NPDC020951 TaxID=3365104 RepID=UPI0037A9348E
MALQRKGRLVTEITDEMHQAMDTALRHRFQSGLRTLAASIRADAEGRYGGAESTDGSPESKGTLLWTEHIAGQLTERQS